MEGFKNQHNEISTRRSSPEENFSENDDQSKKISIIPEDASEDLHIVGLKVQVGDEEAYSFAVDQPSTKLADVSTIPSGSVRLTDEQMCHGQDIADINSIAFFSNRVTSTIKADSEDLHAVPAIEMRFAPNCAEMNDLEIHIKSRSRSRAESTSDEDKQRFSINSGSEDQVACVSENNATKGVSHSVKYLEISPAVQLKSVTELSSTGTQTERVFENSGTQTMSVEVSMPRTKEETASQTEVRRDAWTETEEKTTDSKKSQTQGVSKIQAAVQTETERATGSSQTETAAVFSIERECSASTQTEQTEDAAVATDRDVCIVEREDLRDKSVDTEDLVFVPLMLAKAERAEAEKVQPCEKCCRCSCVPPVPHDNIRKGCHHREHENMCPESTLCQFPQTIPKYILCNLERNYSENTDKCAKTSKNNVLKPYCCKCERKARSEPKMSEADTSVEKIEPPTTVRVDSRKFNSASRVKNSDTSQLGIVKRLRSHLKNCQAFTAVTVFKSTKAENVSRLLVPLFIEHQLTSFAVSVLGPSRVLVNPLRITIQKGQTTTAPEKADARQKMRSAPDRELNGKSKSTLLLLSDQRKKNPFIVSCIPPSESTIQDPAHSRVCLCSECYWNVKEAVQKKESRWPQSDSAAPGKSGADKCAKQRPGRTTSPKIKPRTYNYTSKDAWRPHGQKSEEFLCREDGTTDIVSVGYSSSEESFDSGSTVTINDACETVNNHLLSLRPVDEDTVQEAAKILHRLWFETAGRKGSDVREVRHCMEYFEEFSNNLLKTLLHSVDSNGNNVFHFAFANNRFDLVEELLRKGFTKELLNKRNKNGNSPLLICSISRPKSPSDWLTVRKCFEMGDVNSGSAKNGQTPLMNASSSGFHDMVALLLNLGADPNLQDKDGSTALMYAAEHGHEKCIKTLMMHKRCDPTIRDKDGQTACSIALDGGLKNIAVLIHMQALEKRRLTEKSHSGKRHVWTNVNARARKRALSMMPGSSSSWESHENVHI